MSDSSSDPSPSCALAPYLYMIYKSFILNLNLIDLADLRMHPLLAVWGEEIERQAVSGWKAEQPSGRTTRMPEVKPVSSGE